MPVMTTSSRGRAMMVVSPTGMPLTDSPRATATGVGMLEEPLRLSRAVAAPGSVVLKTTSPR